MSKCSSASHKGGLSGALPELATIISCRLMVGHLLLAQAIGVRVPAREP